MQHVCLLLRGWIFFRTIFSATCVPPRVFPYPPNCMPLPVFSDVPSTVSKTMLPHLSSLISSLNKTAVSTLFPDILFL